MVFTGISGGHDVGWYPHKVESKHVERGPPWGHLYDEDLGADTFLNKLTRRETANSSKGASEIHAEELVYPLLGREYLTEDVAERLGNVPEEELFSNKVRFVVKKAPVEGQSTGGASMRGGEPRG